MIITITGKPGSGKSTVGKLVAKTLNYKFFSAGDLRGEIAMKHGMTIDQLNEVGKTEIWTDKECDDLLAKMGEEQDNMVFDYDLRGKPIFQLPNDSNAVKAVFSILDSLKIP